MASAYSTPHVYKDYVPQIPLQVIQQGLQYKQEKYDANREKVQNYLTSLFNMDIAKEEDQEYFYNRLKTLKSNIDRVGMGDLSLNGVAEQIAQYVGTAVDDNVVRGIAGTKVLRKIQKEADWYKKNKNEKYSDLNYNYSLEGISKWLSDGQVGSNHQPYTQGRTSYIPYTDINEMGTAALKDIKPHVSMIEKLDGSGYYFIDEEHKVISNQRIVSTLEGIVMNDPNVRQQMRINAWGSYERIDVADSKDGTPGLASAGRDYYSGRVEDMQEAIEELQKEKVRQPGRAEEIDESIAAYTERVEEINAKLAAPDWNEYVEKNKNAVALDLYKNNWYNGLISKYAQHDISWKRTQNVEAVERLKNKNKGSNSSLADALKIYYETGNTPYSQALIMASGGDEGDLAEFQRIIDIGTVAANQSQEDFKGQQNTMYADGLYASIDDLVIQKKDLGASIDSHPNMSGVSISKYSDDDLDSLIKNTTDLSFKNLLQNYKKINTDLEGREDLRDHFEEQTRQQLLTEIVTDNVLATGGREFYYDVTTKEIIYKDEFTTSEEFRNRTSGTGLRVGNAWNWTKKLFFDVTNQPMKSQKVRKTIAEQRALIDEIVQTRRDTEYQGNRARALGLSAATGYGTKQLVRAGAMAVSRKLMVGGATAGTTGVGTVPGAIAVGLGATIAGITYFTSKGKRYQKVGEDGKFEERVKYDPNSSSNEDAIALIETNARDLFRARVNKKMIDAGYEETAFQTYDLFDPGNIGLIDDIYPSLATLLEEEGDRWNIPNDLKTVAALKDAAADPESDLKKFYIADWGSGQESVIIETGRKGKSKRIPIDWDRISEKSQLKRLWRQNMSEKYQFQEQQLIDMGRFQTNEQVLSGSATNKGTRAHKIEKAQRTGIQSYIDDAIKETLFERIDIDTPVQGSNAQLRLNDETVSFDPILRYETRQMYDDNNSKPDRPVYIHKDLIIPTIRVTTTKPDGTKTITERIQPDSKEGVDGTLATESLKTFVMDLLQTYVNQGAEVIKY